MTTYKLSKNGDTLDGFIIGEETGFFFEDDGAIINRMADRFMLGESVAYDGSSSLSTGSGSWLWDQGAGSATLAWLEMNARTCATTSRGIGITGAARNNDATIAIGTVGVGVNNGSNASGRSWGFYGEGILNNTNGRAKAMELNGVNLVDVHVDFTPYSGAAQTLGIWLVSGGDANVNPVTYSCDAALGIGTNGNKWDAGIVFTKGSLTREGGATGRAHAIRMAFEHAIEWYEFSTETIGASILSKVEDAAHSQELIISNTGMELFNTDAARMFRASWIANSVNFVDLIPSISTDPVTITAAGADSSVDLLLSGKGAGRVRFGVKTGTGDTATDGYITIKDAAGATVKLATVA